MFSDGETDFGIFKDYVECILELHSLNIFSEEIFVGYRNRFRIAAIFLFIILTGILSSFWSFWNFSDDIEELITVVLILAASVLVLMKVIELFKHGKKIREMIEIVGTNTKALQQTDDHFIGIKHFKRARFYILLTSCAYVSSVLPVQVYPFYALGAKDELTLIWNLQLPGTDNTEPFGWLINYVCVIMISGFCAYIILGEIEKLNF
jgi:hypothetical protein